MPRKKKAPELGPAGLPVAEVPVHNPHKCPDCGTRQE